jgi:hypothetical protein
VQLAVLWISIRVKYTYVVHFAPLFKVGRGARDTRKTGKEPLHEDVDQICGHFLAFEILTPTDGIVEADEIFHGGQIWRSYTVSKALFSNRVLVWRRQPQSGIFLLLLG